METQNLNRFQDALKILDDVSNTFILDVWIPSKQTILKFKEIDAKQQKEILRSSMKSSVYNTEFIKTFYRILHDNLLNKEDENVLNELSIFDKNFIIIALKSKISKDLELVFDEKENIKKKINLENICKSFNTYTHPDNCIVVLKQNETEINVTVGLPTIETEFQYEIEVHKKEKSIDDVKNTEDIQNIVTDAFIGETSKYIKNVKINDIDINYESFSFLQKIKIVEKLPSGLIQMVLENVSEFKKSIDEFLTMVVEENGKTYKKVISADNLMFLS
ncbi:MAG: hypothetical protein RLZZ414_1128 [Bacteroidota bacterium]|jgi:hypothetical protein